MQDGDPDLLGRLGSCSDVAVCFFSSPKRGEGVACGRFGQEVMGPLGKASNGFNWAPSGLGVVSSAVLLFDVSIGALKTWECEQQMNNK